MPQCAAGDRCICPNTPLEERHFCAICKKQLHGPCGEYNGDESAITYRNRCFNCSSAAAISTTTADNNEKDCAPSTTNTSATQQSTLVTAKDIDPKAVTWTDITVGDRPSAKPGETGQMVKSVLTICGIDAMSFNTEQLRQICSNMKLTGYRSKPKADVLRIIGVGKIHQSFYDVSEGLSSSNSDAKAPAKTRNCVFRLINVLFSDEMCPKFERLGEKRDKNVLDSGLAANDEYFWQEVAEIYKETNADYDNLAFVDSIFLGVDPSVKLDHSWSKLREIFKGLTKSYGEIFENHKKSGNHDDFINFCGSKSEVFYLYLWLKDKPQLEPMVVIDLPEGAFFDSGKKNDYEVRRRPSPTNSDVSFARSGSRNSLVASVNALVEERRKSREPGQVEIEINKQKLEMQISRNYDDNVKRLIEVKRQLETETNHGIIKVLKRYEKKLTKVVDFSSSSDSDVEN